MCKNCSACAGISLIARTVFTFCACNPHCLRGNPQIYYSNDTSTPKFTNLSWGVGLVYKWVQQECRKSLWLTSQYRDSISLPAMQMRFTKARARS